MHFLRGSSIVQCVRALPGPALLSYHRGLMLASQHHIANSAALHISHKSIETHAQHSSTFTAHIPQKLPQSSERAPARCASCIAQPSKLRFLVNATWGALPRLRP